MTMDEKKNFIFTSGSADPLSNAPIDRRLATISGDWICGLIAIPIAYVLFWLLGAL